MLRYIFLFFFVQYLYGNSLTLDIGHTLKKSGAISSTCKQEYEYNKELALHIQEELKNQKSIDISLSSSVNDLELSFQDRYNSSINRDLFLSIHHDSVQKQFIKYINGCPTTNHANGFSIFISKKNINFEKSLKYAQNFAKELILEGLTPALHHAENIAGENRELIDENLGIYIFDDLKVLKNANSPAILFEAGVIVNPKDEAKVSTKEFKNKIAKAISKIFN